MKKFIFIGNSIVNGFPLSRGKSFPGRLRAAVKEGRAGFQADIINKGENGNTTADILRRFERDVRRHEPAAVFIMTGTNDFIYREADAEQCFINLERMASLAGEAGITPVYMTPIPVDAEKASHMWMAGMGIDYVHVNEDVAEFSARIIGSGRRFIDIGSAWQAHLESFDSPSDAYYDGVHPTADGYAVLARITADWLQTYAEEL